MERRSLWWDRLGAASGVVFFVLIFFAQSIGADLGTRTHPGQPGADIARVLVENRGDFVPRVYLSLLAVFFLLSFLGYLRRYLAEAEGERGWMASVAYAAGVVVAALLLVSSSFDLAAKVVAENGGDPAAARTLFTMGWEYFGVVNPAIGALTGATSLIALRFRVLPKWLAVIGLLVALAAIFSGFFGAFLVFLGSLWIAAVSVVLLMAVDREPPGTGLDEAEGK